MGFISSLIKNAIPESAEKLNLPARFALYTGKTALRMGVGSAGSRALLGGAVGGLYQAATSNSNDTTNYLGDIGKGILAGGLIGAGSRAITPAWSGGKLSSPWLMKGSMINKAKKIYSAGKFGVKAAYSAANFGLKHPYMTMGAVGGAYALSKGNSSPIYVDPSLAYGDKYNYNQRLQASTQGLVQGMHQGRH